jgi:hypothetical protein
VPLPPTCALAPAVRRRERLARPGRSPEVAVAKDGAEDLDGRHAARRAGERSAVGSVRLRGEQIGISPSASLVAHDCGGGSRLIRIYSSPATRQR